MSDNFSFARYNVPKVPREKLASKQLDSTATTIYTASAGHYVEDAVLFFSNIDSADASYSLYMRDSAGAAAADGNALVSGAFTPEGAHGQKRVEAFGDDQIVEGTSSSNSVVATLVGRHIDRS